jgi:hypothetical protein
MSSVYDHLDSSSRLLLHLLSGRVDRSLLPESQFTSQPVSGDTDANSPLHSESSPSVLQRSIPLRNSFISLIPGRPVSREGVSILSPNRTHQQLVDANLSLSFSLSLTHSESVPFDILSSRLSGIHSVDPCRLPVSRLGHVTGSYVSVYKSLSLAFHVVSIRWTSLQAACYSDVMLFSAQCSSGIHSADPYLSRRSGCSIRYVTGWIVKAIYLISIAIDEME